MLLQNRYWASLLVLTPIAVWLVTIARFAVNVPWFDDFDPFADFLRKWINAADFSEKLFYLFEPNNEHRMVPAKLLTLLYFQLTGKVNFIFLQVCGALFSLGTCWLVFRMFRRLALPHGYFIPVPFLLFQFQFHLIFLWSICSLQHQPSVFFMCLCMFLLAKGKVSWAMLAAAFGTFSFGNGMFIWPAGAVVLLLRHDWRPFLAWVLVGVVAIFFYLYGMPRQGNDSGISYFLDHPYMPIVGLWAFLGGLFDLFSKDHPIVWRTALPVLAGLGLTLFAVLWLAGRAVPLIQTYLKWPKKTPAIIVSIKNKLDQDKVFTDFVVGLLAFSLVNGLVVGFLRPRFGFDVLVVSNYKLYPALFMVSCYLALLLLLVRTPTINRWVYAFSCVGIGIWAISFFYRLPEIAERRKSLLVNAYNQEHNAFGLGFMKGSEAGIYIDSLVKYLVSEGIYAFPDTYTSHFTTMKRATNRLNPETIHLHQKTEQDHLILFQENTPLRTYSDENTFAFLRNEEEMIVFKLNQSPYQGKNFFRQYEKNRHVEIPFDFLKPGEYDVGVLTFKNGEVVCGLIDKIEVNHSIWGE